MTELIVAVAAIIVSALGVLISLLVHRANNRRDTKVEADSYVSKEISLALSPYGEKIVEINSALIGVKSSLDHVGRELEATGTRVGSLLDRTAVLETKVSVFWRNLAEDAAKILHSPDPRRKPIDVLLEAFMAHNITRDQANELKRYLRVIMRWEPNQPWPDKDIPEFPIRDGEQGDAMILLRTMDHLI